MTEVYLDRLALTEARRAADATAQRYATVKGHYDNDPLTHLVGKVGELGADTWFRQRGFTVHAHWRDEQHEQRCDLEVEGCRIEMKTWSSWFWGPWGRCVPVGQMGTLAGKADVVVWATIEKAPRTLTGWAKVPLVLVRLRGFSTLADLHAAPLTMTGPTEKRQVCNRQVDVATVRPFGRLVDRLSATGPLSAQTCAVMPCWGVTGGQRHWTPCVLEGGCVLRRFPRLPVPP